MPRQRWVIRCPGRDSSSASFKHHSLLFRNKPMSVIFALLSPCSNEVLLQVVGSVLIAGHQVERVTVDLHVAADSHVAGRDPLVCVVDVLVPVALQELALNDA